MKVTSLHQCVIYQNVSVHFINLLVLIHIMYVCMYIAGEGPKRPQHRDHP
jgi:hypothetical protein